MKEEIKKLTEEFFEKADFPAEVLVSQADEAFFIKIKTEEAQRLIGQNGQTLQEIQKILKAVLKKKTGSELSIDLDINGYKEKKTEYLRETARDAANEVFLSQKQKLLPIMSSYERRIVHMELANRSDVKTESLGQEPNRRIVVKPI